MPELAIIFTFVIVATILTFGFASAVHKRQIAYKERKDALTRDNNGYDSTASTKKIAKLEDRVRVLERLATDRSPDLAAQIESLRDLSEIENRTASKEKVQ